ncbi:MAG: helix-turn-helix domain-containing protein [Clostridia bacterium]|nr:helix-turn-helix domain-containing protein [Clostridia bacterium]
MPEVERILERLSSISRVSVTLVDDGGNLLSTWPKEFENCANALANRVVIEDFRRRKRDERRPMVRFVDPGFLLGIVQLGPRQYVMIGLVSPYPHTRAEILKTISEAIPSEHLSVYGDFLLRQPLMSLEQMKDLICLMTDLCGDAVPEEDILFADSTASARLESGALDETLFARREEAEQHVPVDFETAICSAVETGNRAMLERRLFTPHHGRVGRMSPDGLRQQKYAFICLATLVSRAAIRGGMLPETAFSLSDLYCQRMDLLAGVPAIQNLVITMLTDYCARVREIRQQPSTSPVVKNCLSYISVHLHEPITLERLSRHVGLCARSLSMKFKAEVGMGIPEYIHQEKLREAEYLLLHTDYSLSEITIYLNYPNQSYFTQIFKKYRNSTPLQFREARGRSAGHTARRGGDGLTMIGGDNI